MFVMKKQNFDRSCVRVTRLYNNLVDFHNPLDE
jgi:hypothetical protein